MPIRNDLEQIFRSSGLTDFKWINPSDLVVAQWVRMKCTWGCDSYGKNAHCPPNTPPVGECRDLFNEYRIMALFHFAAVEPDRAKRHEWSQGINARLLQAERSVFLAGYHKAFACFIDGCHSCQQCATSRLECKNNKTARPALDAMAVDVFQTARNVGYTIGVLTDKTQEMNRYGILLVE